MGLCVRGTLKLFVLSILFINYHWKENIYLPGDRESIPNLSISAVRLPVSNIINQLQPGDNLPRVLSKYI